MCIVHVCLPIDVVTIVMFVCDEEDFLHEAGLCCIISVCVQNQHETSAAGTSLEAQESSLAEECDAICRLHGVPGGAPLPAQLKAIDTEYHQLLDKGQSAKADHVQALFAWKSKTATQVPVLL